jgi:suppressor of fused protein SUFU
MSDDEWKRMWDARKTALESVLGPAEETVLHAFVPFHLGGQADVLTFRKHIAGRVAATCELLGEPSQKPNLQGTYELAIAHRDESEWGPNVISKLARYTCDAVLQPGQTMDIGPAVPPKSTISGFFFDDFKRMKFKGTDAGLLLCIGLTEDELTACKQGKRQMVYDALVAQKVFPYTELFRASVLKPLGGGFWRRLTGGGA